VTDATDLLPGLTERFRTVRGVRIRFYEGGEGPPLLLLHGFGGAAWNFTGLAALLPGRRLLIPDLPGHGGSEPLPAASMSAFADVVAELLTEPTAALGHSMGGVVALRLAERRPDLVTGLVLAAAAGITSSTRASEASLALAGLVQPGRIAGRHVDRIARSRPLRKLVFGRFEVANADALPERAVYGFLGATRLHTDALGAGLALARDDPRECVERIRCPALVIHGARDRQVPIEDGFEYARLLGARLRLVADCGHLLIGERPDVCARAVLDFCAPATL
jgi:pimeloyl-ACP methyl ester carboxylesterase